MIYHKRRSIPVAIVLSLVTCGIYGLYWYVCITDEVASACDDHSISGVSTLIFTIITCGIYQLYWAYKIGNLSAQLKARRGYPADSQGILFIILAVLGLNIVNMAIVQDELNYWGTEE